MRVLRHVPPSEAPRKLKVVPGDQGDRRQSRAVSRGGGCLGFCPARKAAHLDPTAALRDE
jgi:hypothetical protein